MKYKTIIYAITLILLLALFIPNLGCTSGSITDAKSFMTKIPEDINEFTFMDIDAFQHDDDLDDIYNAFEDMLEDALDMLGIDIDDANTLATYGEDSTVLLYGNFYLNEIREALDDLDFNDEYYRNTEIWENNSGYGWVALMGNLIIYGSKDNVQDCIKVIKSGEDSMLDDNDCKDIMDRLPAGIMVIYSTDEEYSDTEAWGASLQKKDDDTMEMIGVFKFRDANAAEDAVDEVEDDMAEEWDVTNINIDQDGEFLILTAEMAIDDFLKEILDDNYEQNDTWETAYNLSSWEDTWLSTIDGPGIKLDVDCYQIEAGGNVQVDCQFTHSEGDIDIALDDSSGRLLTGSSNSTNNEHIEYTVPAAGTYYIIVFGEDAGNTYDLWWDDVADDNYEQNDTWETAYNLSSLEYTWLSNIIDGSGIQFDDDWYQIEVTSGEEIIQVDCQFNHSEGDINIALCDFSGSPLAYSDSVTDNEYIQYSFSSLGTYYIRVYGANAGNTYDLWWDVGYLDDNYEQNDTWETAYDLSSREYYYWLYGIDGYGIQADDDWYQIALTAPIVKVDCRFTHSEGDINIALCDSSGRPLASSESINDNEYIEYNTGSSFGTYYIRVYGANAGNTYDLWWDDVY